MIPVSPYLSFGEYSSYYLYASLANALYSGYVIQWGVRVVGGMRRKLCLVTIQSEYYMHRYLFHGFGYACIILIILYHHLYLQIQCSEREVSYEIMSNARKQEIDSLRASHLTYRLHPFSLVSLPQCSHRMLCISSIERINY